MEENCKKELYGTVNNPGAAGSDTGCIVLPAFPPWGLQQEPKVDSGETPRQLYGVINNFDSTGKPAGCCGPVGSVSTQDRYKGLRGKLRGALRDAYSKFAEDYRLKYRSRPGFGQVRELAKLALNDFLAEVPQPEPQTLPEMLDGI